MKTTTNPHSPASSDTLEPSLPHSPRWRSLVSRQVAVPDGMKPFRLHKLILKHVELAGNVTKLHQFIREANDKARTRCCSIARNTLERLLADPGSVKLTWANLVALDAYLTQFGDGLDVLPILEKPGVLEAVAENRQVSFLIGSKPRQGMDRSDTSPWDTESFGHILTALCKFDFNVHYDVQHVGLSAPESVRELTGEKWYRLIHAGARSLISIGSPRASLASEIMLARMFGVRPFGKPKAPGLDTARLPFHYIFVPKRMRNLRSRFYLSAEDIAGEDHELAREVRNNRTSAFRWRGKLLPISESGSRWKMYGVIVAQRRKEGQTWVVLSGNSGPATYAAATKLQDVSAMVPSETEEDSPVLCVLVEAIVTRRENTGGEKRVLRRCVIKQRPFLWKRPKEDDDG